MDPFGSRFSGIGRLYSANGLARLRQSHVCVIGVGGVGSWAVEALARSGVGQLTLVDLDDVCISNINRQLHAVASELGKPKVEALKRRVHAINPGCVVNMVQSFFLKSNAEEILSQPFNFVLDAMDGISMKCVLISMCREKGIPVITTGAAAGRRDPTAIEVIDLAFSSHDRLLQDVRKKLRTRYGFPRHQQPFGVECVLSREPVVYAREDGSVCHWPDDLEKDLRLDCHSGFGTASFVTGTFGFVAASRVVQKLATGLAQAVCDNVASTVAEPELKTGL